MIRKGEIGLVDKDWGLNSIHTQVVEQSPCKISLDCHAILRDGFRYGVQVRVKVSNAEGVVDRLLASHLVFAGARASILRDVDGLAVKAVNSGEMLAEHVRARPQPVDAALFSSRASCLVLLMLVDGTEEVRLRDGAVEMAGKLRGIVVHTIKISFSGLEDGKVGGSKSRQSVAQLLLHAGRIVLL